MHRPNNPIVETAMVSPKTLGNMLLRIWDASMPRLQRYLAKRRRRFRVELLLAKVTIRIQAFDQGRVDFEYRIVNRLPYGVVLDHVEMDHWQIDGHSLSEQSAWLKASGSAELGETGWARFSVPLLPGDIRAVIQRTKPAGHSMAAPSLGINSRFTSVFEAGGKKFKVQLEQYCDHPVLQIAPDLDAEKPS
jgi:hypothetical protein